ncbi:cobalamin biosynthesis protein [Pseudoroseomonas cervicalis]|uniref:cobalamin biosynthesis protein n=1 Tax=Teichococcus cervicalis TaxID=204525 RepID=UPI0027D7E43B|nr:cobalamin biosynthesis protein [Pseudoroseomonas cervicalis]
MAGSGETLSPQRGPGAAPLATAGLGLRPSATGPDLVALIRRAEELSGHRVARLAAPAFREGAEALSFAADSLGLPVVFIDRDALLAVQGRCPSRSEASLRATGIASVAEGCALAQGGRLVLARIDGSGVSCALSTESET